MILVQAVVAAALAGAGAGEVEVKFVGSGAMPRIGGYMPLRAEMDGKPDLVKVAPKGLAAPKYGTIKIGEKGWAFVLDEPEGKPATLYVDTDGDGDLTDDPPTTWEARKVGEFQQSSGTARVDLGGGKLASLGLYRFDPADARRAPLKNTMMYYTDYGYELTLNLDGKPFTTFTGPESRMPLWLDRDGNGQRSGKYETVRLGEPFNFTGTTYVLTKEGETFALKQAGEAVPQLPMAPDLTVGKPALAFTAAALDGSKVDFPKDYAGKLVMLDFWATWCGPCIAELPNVKKAYADWHDKGFEVLGVSFDQPDMKEKVESFLREKELPWRQVYEGKGWETTLGEKYDVSAIPFVLLVDGDSGAILATSRELRGPGLSEFIGKQLEKKAKP